MLSHVRSFSSGCVPMKIRYKYRLYPAVVLLITFFTAGCQTKNSNEWKLAWEDDFSGKRLDKSIWNVLIRENSKHNELQYYIPEEVFVEKGLLRIRSSVRKYGSQEYTSGRIYTKDKFAPVYGRFEIRAKLPAGQGIWPAYWLYPQNRDWQMEQVMSEAVADGRESLIPEERPWYTEIDIMEFLGHEPDILYGTYHYYTFDGHEDTSHTSLPDHKYSRGWLMAGQS